MKDSVTFKDFAKLDLRIGKVVNCEKKEGSEKLFRLTVDFGDEGEKKIFSGIAKWYSPNDLLGKSFIFIINLEPRKMMDEISEGMLLAAGAEHPVLLCPNEETPPGTTIL